MKRWQKQEVKTARRYGGRRTPGSGSKWGFKGDVKTEIFLIDDKTTEKKSYSITSLIWNKIRTQAIQEGRRPALKVTLVDGTSFVVLDEPDFYEIVEKAKNEKSV